MKQITLDELQRIAEKYETIMAAKLREAIERKRTRGK